MSESVTVTAKVTYLQATIERVPRISLELIPGNHDDFNAGATAWVNSVLKGLDRPKLIITFEDAE